MCTYDKTVFLKSIEAMVPTYDHKGNNACNVLYAEEERKLLPISVSRFMRSWFHFLHIDLYAQRMWSREILGHRNLNPIIINEHAIFIPVKLREAVGKKDGSYGYIRVSRIADITCDYILLGSGTKILYLSSHQTIKKKILHANLLKYKYLEELKLQRMIYTSTEDDSPGDWED